MKVLDFNGVQVHSPYDGIGTIKEIDKPLSIPAGTIEIKFKNGSNKRFYIPLAFESGLLSSKNKKFNEYIKNLSSENKVYKSSLKQPNEDIPTLQELGIVVSNYGLNEKRLAMLGALDDFYQVYTDIDNLIALHMKNFTRSSSNKKTSKYSEKIYNDFPISLDTQIKRMVELLLKKYLYIFTNEYNKIFAYSYAFETFLYYYHKKDYHVSFEHFYLLVQGIYIKTFFHWKSLINPKITQEEVFYYIKDRIQVLSYIQEKKSLIPSTPSHYSQESHILHVMKSLSNTSCYQQKHTIIANSYNVPLANRNNSVSLPVHYCTTCHKYFIGDMTLQEYEKCYGRLLATKNFCEDIKINDDVSFNTFSAESLLHQYGYNVRSNNLSDIERHQILIDLIDTKKLSHHEICRTIEQNIHLFQRNPKYSQAVSKWQSDLKFIGDYIKSQK